MVYNISQDRNDLRGKAFLFEGSIPMMNATEEQRKKKFQVEKNLIYLKKKKSDIIMNNFRQIFIKVVEMMIDV